MKSVLLRHLLGLAAAACISNAATSDLPTRFTVVQGRPVVKSVYLNGQGPFRFLLDTGAEASQLDEMVASRLGLRATERVELQTVAGSLLVPGTQVNSIVLGEMQAADTEMLLTNLNVLHTLDARLDGVLGANFLRNFDFQIDFDKRLLLQAPLRGEHVPISISGGLVSVETGNGPMLLDSGTDTLICFGRPRIAANSVRLHQAVLHTSAGTALANELALTSVQIGSKTFALKRPPIQAAPRAFSAGILPVNVFRKIYFSHSGGYIVVE